MKLKRLISDDRYAANLPVRNLHQVVDLWHIAASTRQVNQIGDGFERIVDLMRDGTGKPAHSRKLFAVYQSFLCRPRMNVDFTLSMLQELDRAAQELKG